MLQDLECPLCHEKVYSEIGNGCKMCGMPFGDEAGLFCCEKCEEIYGEIHESL